jgi:hypothetical protein
VAGVVADVQQVRRQSNRQRDDERSDYESASRSEKADVRLDLGVVSLCTRSPQVIVYAVHNMPPQRIACAILLHSPPTSRCGWPAQRWCPRSVASPRDRAPAMWAGSSASIACVFLVTSARGWRQGIVTQHRSHMQRDIGPRTTRPRPVEVSWCSRQVAPEHRLLCFGQSGMGRAAARGGQRSSPLRFACHG